MKKIITLIVFLNIMHMQSQDINALTNDIWAIQEYYAIHEESGERTDLYNFNNEEDLDTRFDGLLYDFQTSGNVTVTLDGVSENKNWTFFASGDSLNMDNASFKLINLTNDEFVVRNSTNKYGIELNYYLKLSPAVSLANKEFNFNRYVEVYPNPASDILNLEFDNAIASNLKEIAIINVTGNYVKTSVLGNSNIQKIALSNLANGLYFIKIIDKLNTTIAVKKIVIHQ